MGTMIILYMTAPPAVSFSARSHIRRHNQCPPCLVRGRLPLRSINLSYCWSFRFPAAGYAAKKGHSGKISSGNRVGGRLLPRAPGVLPFQPSSVTPDHVHVASTSANCSGREGVEWRRDEAIPPDEPGENA